MNRAPTAASQHPVGHRLLPGLHLLRGQPPQIRAEMQVQRTEAGAHGRGQQQAPEKRPRIANLEDQLAPGAKRLHPVEPRLSRRRQAVLKAPDVPVGSGRSHDHEHHQRDGGNGAERRVRGGVLLPHRKRVGGAEENTEGEVEDAQVGHQPRHLAINSHFGPVGGADRHLGRNRRRRSVEEGQHHARAHGHDQQPQE